MTIDTSQATDADRVRAQNDQIDKASLALASANAQLEFLTEITTNGFDKKPEAFGNLRFSVFEELVWSISERVDAARAALHGKSMTPLSLSPSRPVPPRPAQHRPDAGSGS